MKLLIIVFYLVFGYGCGVRFNYWVFCFVNSKVFKEWFCDLSRIKLSFFGMLKIWIVGESFFFFWILSYNYVSLGNLKLVFYDLEKIFVIGLNVVNVLKK